VFGVGSYTYQYTTRDTFGFAIKATYAEVNGEPREIFKTPKTDDGTKNSAKGLVAVYHDGNDDTWNMKDQATWEEVKNCSLQLVYKDGVLVRNESIDDIRRTLRRWK
jgi:nicotinamide phosphoribosyltransferase